MSVTSTPKKGLTRAQISLYWKSFSAACAELGLRSREERENYRKKTMLAAAGKVSLKDLDRTSDFDAVLARFFADAGDYQRAAEASVQDAKRLGFLIKVCCCQLMQLKGGDQQLAWRYLDGILDRSQISHGRNLDNDGYWLDLSFREAHSVFSMLDTHRRRLLRPWRGNLSFSPRLRYSVDGPIFCRYNVDESYYANQPFAVGLSND